ncbi:MAG: outer membrane beta-barrel protein [Bacteroidetes bacterium]|nr:outer membrane beta-barrel protein [Bacteroidota bacterium]
MRILKFGLVVLIIHFTLICFAQNSNCINSLFNANKSFEVGDFAGTINQLQPCLKNGFTADEKFDVYRLMALSYFYLNKGDSLDYFIKAMLGKKPEYLLFPNIGENEEFLKKVNSYEVIPYFFIAIGAGMNVSRVNLIQKYSPTTSSAYYESNFGVQYGGSILYNPIKNLSCMVGLQYSQVAYRHVIDTIADATQQYREQLNYINIPLGVRYTYPRFKIKPFVEAGYEFSFLQDAIVVLQSNSTVVPTKQPNLLTDNRKAYRNATNNSYTFGGGLMYPLGPGNLFIDVKYKLAQHSLVPADKRYADIAFVFDKQYVDDDFKLDDVQIMAGFQLPLLYRVSRK